MSAKRTVLVGLLVPFMFAGCLMVPGPRGEGVVLVPPLPPIVVLGAEPYYVHDGYHYYYRNNGWYYSHSRRGPWLRPAKRPLPKRGQVQGWRR